MFLLAIMFLTPSLILIKESELRKQDTGNGKQDTGNGKQDTGHRKQNSI